MAAESNQRAPKYTFDESYGSIGSNALARNRRVRLVAVALSMAALALVAMVWPQGQTRISAFQMGESKNWSNFEPSANAEAYIDGEKNILDLFFRESEATNTMVDKAYAVARQRLVKRLEEELEAHFQEEVQEALRARRDKLARSQIQSEIGALGKSMEAQQTSVQGLAELGAKIRALELDLCSGKPCKEVPEAIVSKERGRWADKEQEYAAQIAALQKKSKDWEDKARKYLAMLQSKPPPPRCAGLTEVDGASGNITTGVSTSPAGTVEDCRWIIRAPPGRSSITLQFSEVHIMGDKSRVSIFVGPENVALYKNEDVVNWSSAYRSFSGSTFPLPVHCNSNEVTDPRIQSTRPCIPLLFTSASPLIVAV